MHIIHKRTGRFYDQKGFRFLIILLSGFLIIVYIYAIILSALAPRKYLNKLRNLYPKTDTTVVIQNAGFDFLERKENFLKNRIEMAKLDSVSLSLDLIDSLLCLELKGVVLQSVTIEKIKISPMVSRINPSLITEMFSKSCQVDRDYSTIPKERFLIKNAPKDTSDILAVAPVSDTSQREFVGLRFWLDNGFCIEIIQSDSQTEKEQRSYNYQNNLEKSKSIVANISRFQVPQYQPCITIEVNGKKARTIYRAIPSKALVAVRL
jgi:hypothetical protein